MIKLLLIGSFPIDKTPIRTAHFHPCPVDPMFSRSFSSDFPPRPGRDPCAEDGPGDAAGGEASAAEVGEFDAKVGGAKKDPGRG